MDPRPIHFEFIRKRPNNRTFQSWGLQDSMRYIGLYDRQIPDQRYKRFFRRPTQSRSNKRERSAEKPDNNNPENMLRNRSMDLDASKKASSSIRKGQFVFEKQGSMINRAKFTMNGSKAKSSEPLFEKIDIPSSSLSKYGANLINNNLNQQYIFQKQQKPFNIITMQPNKSPKKPNYFLS